MTAPFAIFDPAPWREWGVMVLVGEGPARSYWPADFAETMRDKWTGKQRADLDAFAASLTEALRQLEAYHEKADAA